MADMHALIALMREIEEQLTVCMRCGMCQAVCPLYAETGRESDVARGKLALLDGLLQEMFDKPHGVAERLHKCLLCGSCQAGCPSGVRVIEIFLKARAVLAAFSGLSAAQKILLRGMLARPGVLDRTALWGARFQKMLTRPVNDILGTSCARIASPLIGDRHFRPLAERPFHQDIPKLLTPPGASGRRVAFFVGCLIDKIYPRIAHAAVNACGRLGVGVFIPESLGCCGIPALSAGDTAAFQRLVRYNLAQLQQASFDFLVTACATCTSTIKKLWPLMLEGKDSGLQAQAVQLADKTLDISQFLVDKLNLTGGEIESAQGGRIAPAQGGRIAVTYHDPCHLRKSLGISAQPRAVLKAIPGCRLIEMPSPDQCCGMGGSFNLKHYRLSRRIGEHKRDAIRASGCRVVATSCPACMLQMSDILSRSGDGVAVKHVIELFAEGLNPYADAVTADQAEENQRPGFRTGA